ncbi:MAG: hypothetical protein OXF88_22505 [Rhodobacteraceae bacterium]|nr:hypothetical protein [Paracoccaceae bacterium]MCY4137223.1 hypothetical protein [Paracoccaceae bacterium]
MARFSVRTFPRLRTITARPDPGKAVRELGEVPGTTAGRHAHDIWHIWYIWYTGKPMRATMVGDRSFGHRGQARAPLNRMLRRVSNRCRVDTAWLFRVARAWNTMVNAETPGDTRVDCFVMSPHPRTCHS